MNSLGLMPGTLVLVSHGAVPVKLARSVVALGLSTDLRAQRSRAGAPLLLNLTRASCSAIVAWIGAQLLS